jgi:hypothetical protein
VAYADLSLCSASAGADKQCSNAGVIIMSPSHNINAIDPNAMQECRNEMFV